MAFLMNPNSISPTASVRVLQITDTHLFANPQETMRGCATAQTLNQVIRAIQPLCPTLDALLLTGDLSQDETPESYRRLYEMIAPLSVPTYWIPGNHDDFHTMGTILNQPPFQSQKTVNLGNWTLILLNTQEPRQVAGRLSPNSLTWLEEQLKQGRDRPTLLVMHHPPCRIESAWMDDLRLQNSQDFYQVIDSHPQVKGVVFGHIHQAFEAIRRQIPYLGSPSTCIQFKPQTPTLVLDDGGPGCRLLTLQADGHLEAQVLRI